MSTTAPMTVAEYDQRIATGMIAEDDQVELLEGIITTKVPEKPLHRFATRRTLNALGKFLPTGWDAFKDDAIVCGDHSRVKPDVSVVRAEVCNDPTRDATAADCCLIVELAEASLEVDRGTKLVIYARARVPVYWIVNLIDNHVEVYLHPDQDPVTYGVCIVYHRGEHIPVTIAGRSWARLPVMRSCRSESLAGRSGSGPMHQLPRRDESQNRH
jgi:Uma2 family endonuclease